MGDLITCQAGGYQLLVANALQSTLVCTYSDLSSEVEHITRFGFILLVIDRWHPHLPSHTDYLKEKAPWVRVWIGGAHLMFLYIC